MNPHRRATLHDVAQYFGLAIEYAGDLPSGFHGCLEPGGDPRFIVINSNQPVFEQEFTIAHELGHHVLHQTPSEKDVGHWIMTHRWQSILPAQVRRSLRLAMALIINRECQADIWALCLLISLRQTNTLDAYLRFHPEKKFWLFLARIASIGVAIRSNLRALPAR